VLTTNQKGLLAETAIVKECVQLGIGVAKPFDDERYDLVFDLRSELLRIQCKWAVQHGGVVVVRLYSSRRGPSGTISRPYSEAEVDGFAAYCHRNDTCYFMPGSFARFREIRFRLGPTRNNQSLGIRWAKDYEFAATLRPHGAVAQLGERLAGSQKVRGSIPLGSIPPPG
jgi:PD-(D/E)XK nuclease superfamily protein